MNELGIDDTSSVSDICEALDRLCIRLDIEEAGPGRWQARARDALTGAEAPIDVSGADERSVALAAYRRLLALQGSSGVS